MENLFKNIVDTIPADSPTKIIQTKKKLRIKIGLDPTSAKLHLGHLVILKKLRELQDQGHFVLCVIGDFTGQIGDPTGKKNTREKLNYKITRDNCKTYEEQILKILKKNNTQFFYNSSWLSKLTSAHIIELLSICTTARILERKDFKQRIAEKNPITLSELIYPILQGYDSVILAADIEIGGMDQKFNILIGRFIQKKYNQKQQIALLLPLLPGTDGERKMSKSLLNCINITETPKELFGKIMSINDKCTEIYYDYLNINDTAKTPLNSKKNLAEMLVTLLYDVNTAIQERTSFQLQYTEKQNPEKIPCFYIKIGKGEKITILELLKETKLFTSSKEIKRLITQKAIKINNTVINEYDFITSVNSKSVLQVGKHKFLEIIYTV